jgi:stage V sporulation protein G
MQVTKVQIEFVNGEKVIGLARIEIDSELVLTNLRVIKGTNGLFVSYPVDTSYRGDDYRSVFYPKSRELREYIQETVFAEYAKMKNGK